MSREYDLAVISSTLCVENSYCRVSDLIKDDYLSAEGLCVEQCRYYKNCMFYELMEIFR